MGLEFDFKEFIDEISCVSSLARKFIRPDSLDVLLQLKNDLEQIQRQGSDRIWPWAIPESRPLCTISTSEYHHGGGGPYKVYAAVSSKWEIKRVKPKRKNITAQKFELVGLASTRVRLYREFNDHSEEIAMWRMEIGSHDSPGCHFHVQILGERENTLFPHSLEIPRLPGLFASPPFAFEFLLGEIFQDSWEQEISPHSSHLQRWRAIQKERLIRLFDWQRKDLAESSNTGSPWLQLKRLKPKSDLFISNAS